MSVRYIYKGMLTRIETQWVESVGVNYGFCVEITDLPENWLDWSKANMREVVYDSGEDAGGGTYVKKSIQYSTFGKEDGSSMFLFFKFKDEKDKFTKDFPGLIIDDNPFSTAIGDVPEPGRIQCLLQSLSDLVTDVQTGKYKPTTQVVRKGDGWFSVKQSRYKKN